MFRRVTLVQGIVAVILFASILIAWSVLYLADRQLREIADRSQSELYAERIENIVQLLDQKNDRLLATGMPETYIDDFQNSVLKYLRRAYYKSTDQSVYPFIQQLDGTTMLHPLLKKGSMDYADTLFSRTALRMRNGEFNYDYFGEPKWAIVRTYGPWGWVIGYAVPQSVKYHDALVFKKWMSFILPVITLLACLSVSFVIWRMTRPIRELTVAARAVTEGNLDFTVPAGWRGDIGVLSDAFVSMRTSIRDRIQSLNSEIAERRRTEELLREAKAQAEVADKTKSLFLANMSHEIRTPLNGLMGMLQLMQMSPLNRDQREFVDMAFQSGTRLMRLLSDILDLSRVEAGKIVVTREAFELQKVMTDLAATFIPSVDERGLVLDVQTGPEIPPLLVGDPERLQQVLSNLVGNAIKFTESGTIRVEAHPLPSGEVGVYRVLFTVSDTGIGISDEILGKLFTPFTQAETDFHRRYQGAGLGLTISKRLVMLMGGNMAVESDLGKGSTFYVCIPFSLPKGVAVEPRQGHGSEMSEGLKILLAEDDRISRISMKKTLENMGHEVVAVDNGAEALEELGESSFDLVLMDVQMPIMDGVEATKIIRSGKMGAEKAELPIIALTAYAMEGDKEIFYSAGMDGYLAKPVEIEHLKAVVTETLDRNRSRAGAEMI